MSCITEPAVKSIAQDKIDSNLCILSRERLPMGAGKFLKYPLTIKATKA